MSADNLYYIRKIGRKWYVWHDFASSEPQDPTKLNCVIETNRRDAIVTAHDLNMKFGTEYGVVELTSEA